MKVTKVLGTAGLASAASAFLLMASSGAAVAGHDHVKVVGNGGCIVLAGSGGESAVDLPPAVFTQNPTVNVTPTAGRNHPLHVLVHQGVPPLSLYVLGSTDAATFCPEPFINR